MIQTLSLESPLPTPPLKYGLFVSLRISALSFTHLILAVWLPQLLVQFLVKLPYLPHRFSGGLQHNVCIFTPALQPAEAMSDHNCL